LILTLFFKPIMCVIVSLKENGISEIDKKLPL
jgi:hypothetical protein